MTTNYKEHHRIANVFRRLTQWRGSVTRYAKCIDSLLAALSVRCIFLAF
ncbi:MAG: hypothetical protein LBP19_03725 [Treponema sp.]|nr:hypothetical protein [Treponema sp.]